MRGAAGRGGEGLETLRVVQKTAENCKELGIRTVVVRILRNVEGNLARQLLVEARGSGFIEGGQGPVTAAPPFGLWLSGALLVWLGWVYAGTVSRCNR